MDEVEEREREREREREEERDGVLFVVSETDREIVIRVAERGKRGRAP